MIAARDPGIHNWVDSSGLHEGGLFIRWQVLPDTPNALEAAVREVKVIKLSALQGLLPAETTRVTPQQRKALYQQRTLNYHQRYTSSDAIDQPLVKRDMSK